MPIKKNLIKKALILAGGKGKRFRPYSFVIPKPLIPFQSKDPIISNVINNIGASGIKEFYFALGYLDTLVKSFLMSRFEKKIKLNFITEKKELGTAGPLRLLKKFKKNERILISNGDIITNLNFKKILKFYEKKNFDILIFVHRKKIKSTYGVVENKGIDLKSIIEKPTITTNINSGIYVINTDIIKIIPKNTFFTMVDLINSALKLKKKIIVHKFSEKWRSIESPSDLK